MVKEYSTRKLVSELLMKKPTQLNKAELQFLHKHATIQQKIAYFRKHHLKSNERIIGVRGRFVTTERRKEKRSSISEHGLGNFNINTKWF